MGGAAVGHDLVREEDPVDALLVPHQQRLLRVLAPLPPRPVGGKKTYFRGLSFTAETAYLGRMVDVNDVADSSYCQGSKRSWTHCVIPKSILPLKAFYFYLRRKPAGQ